jgi:hypothetical protein
VEETRGLATHDLVTLYGIEAGLIQQKASHVLAIRSLAVSVFVAIAGASLFYPDRGLQWLAFVLIPFYVLDAVYDGYLIPIARRETLIREEIARRAESGQETIAEAFRSSPNHRFAPKSWSPFRRALVEPVRLAFYVALIAGPIICAHFASALAAAH